MNKRIRIAVACLIGALIVAGGGIAAFSSSGNGDSTPSNPITVSDQYATSTVNDVAAVYFTIHNSGPEDTLLGVSTNVSDSASLHETVTQGNSSSMQNLQDLKVPSNGELVFKTGGNHVMIDDLKNGLQAGQQVTVTLTFQKAGTLTFIAPVKDR